MEKIKPEDINDPTNSPFVQMTVLNNLLKKIYSDVSVNQFSSILIVIIFKIHFSEDLVRCCLIPKVNDTNKVYLEKVEQCFVNWKHKAQVPIQKLKNMAIFCRDLQVKFHIIFRFFYFYF